MNFNLGKVVVKAAKTADVTARLNQGADVAMVCATPPDVVRLRGLLSIQVQQRTGYLVIGFEHRKVG